jgi:Sigma-70, region 4
MPHYQCYNMLQFVICVTVCNTRGVGNGSAGTSDCSKFSVNYMSTLIGLLKGRNPTTLLRDKVAAVAIQPATSRTGRASLSRMRLQVGVCHPLLRGSTSHEQREVLLLVGLEGMRYEQVATILGIPVGTVRSRLSRARTTLRLLMDGVQAASNRDTERCDALAA